MGIEAAIAAPLIGGAVNLYGASRARQAQRAAADRQLALQREMMAAAGDAARFRPVGVTSPYGRTRFEVRDGQLVGAGFTLSPELQARAARFAELGETALAGLTADPMEAARQRTARLEELAQPGRAVAQERLFSDLAAKGLTGIGVSTGEGAAVNPYVAAQQEAIARQQALTAAESFDLARQQQQEDLAMAQRYFAGQTGLFDVGQKQLGAALDIADLERMRRMEGASRQAGFGSNISNIMGDAGAFDAQALAALYGGAGEAIRTYGPGLFSGSGADPISATDAERLRQYRGDVFSPDAATLGINRPIMFGRIR